VRQVIKKWNKKTQLTLSVFSLPLSTRILYAVVIEQPNTNVTIPSCVYLFHPGLPFFHTIMFSNLHVDIAGCLLFVMIDVRLMLGLYALLALRRSLAGIALPSEFAHVDNFISIVSSTLVESFQTSLSELHLAALSPCCCHAEACEEGAPKKTSN